MINVAVAGASGRMGKAIIALARNRDFELSSRLRITGALETTAAPELGQDAGVVAGCEAIQVDLTDSRLRALDQAQVIIDFTRPEATLALAAECAKQGVGMVIGTTGFSDAERGKLLSYADKIPLLIEPNMSLGVNLLFKLIKEATAVLGADFDIEVVETHHRHKTDSPSGTAVRIKELLRAGTERQESDIIYGRVGTATKRKSSEIGVHAVRGGDIVGDHSVLYFGEGEMLELRHRATSRNTFASGALRAACFMAEARPGCYDLQSAFNL